MKIKINLQICVFFIVFLFFMTCFCSISLSDKIDQNYGASSMMEDGQILYAPMFTTNTYLREKNWALNHTWSSNYLPGVAVLLLDDGTMLRALRIGANPLGGAGGGIEKVEWDGTVVWDFRYNTDGVLSHHDIKTLPNGNVLMIAWETKSRSEAIAAGRNPNLVSNNGLWPDHLIEVEPTGPSSGDIVWEWHAWDHLIQDYDSSKDNYGVVGDHPELIDINYGTSTQTDIMHTNSIYYNEEFDQIMISVHNYNEIWIIDHSTTTQEAAGHTGGNYGMGGDLLYRWGNPRAYDRGSSSDQKLFGQHDATWIKDGYPGEGNILVFNNGGGRLYSSVDEIIPPVNENGEYYLEEGQAYGPKEQTWIYTADPPNSFYSQNVGGAHRLENGNTLISNGHKGYVFEVTQSGTTVWEQTIGGQFFKVFYISPSDPEPEIPDLECNGKLYFNYIESGSTVNGDFEVSNIGGPGSFLNWEIESYPDWGTWTIEPTSGENLTPEDEPITVDVTIVVPPLTDTEFDGYITVVNTDDVNDTDDILVYIKTPRQITNNLAFLHFLKNHEILLPIVRQLFHLF
ncbi:hypothetical protein AYK21_05215 [Thermoplasmatales archaeon SG8-52-2]|nr:MAG: hypothetical protein AYK21_05215 [Thermoplasmatales archaeon SG8-52-2]